MAGLGLDLLKHGTNVHWGGASEFAIGGTARDTTAEGPMGVFYSRPGGKTEEEKTWTSTHIDRSTPAPPAAVNESGPVPRQTGLRFNYLNAMVGGRFDKDTVVLVAGGYRSYVISVDIDAGGLHHYNHQTIATLFYSEDGGKTWTEASNPVTAPPGQSGDPSKPSGINVDVQVNYLAFDPQTKTFYGDVFKIGNDAPGPFQVYAERTLISSTDGKSWSAGASNRVNLLTGPGNWTSAFLGRILSIKNNGLTEVMKTDATPEVKLTYETATVIPDVFGGKLKLAPPWKIELFPPPDGAEEDPPFSGTITGVPYGEKTGDGTYTNKGMAYAKGRFLIAGSLMAAFDNKQWDVMAYMSSDGGETWKQTLDDSSTFTTSDPYVEGGIGCAGSPGCAGA